MDDKRAGGFRSRCRKLHKDNQGSAIVIVIIAMAMIGILASTIVWASYLNYRIKVSDLKVKNSFYSAETVVEQILAGVKKNIVAASVNEAYQEVVSNWDALETDANRESYFVTAYTAAVEEKLGVAEGSGKYDPKVLAAYVDGAFLDGDTGTAGNIGSAENGTLYETDDWLDAWENAGQGTEKGPLFTSYEKNRLLNPTVGTMTVKNICVEFYDSDGLLSIINTDLAIDVPKLQFTQAGSIDRLYSYVLVGDDGIVTADSSIVNISGSIYGGAYEEEAADSTHLFGDGAEAAAAADAKDGIRIGQHSHVTVSDANYVISGSDIVVGNAANFVNLIDQDAQLVVRNAGSGTNFNTSVYAGGLAVNGSYLNITGKTYVANDLILSGKGSSVNLTGQYLGYGGSTTNKGDEPAKNKDLTDKVDADGNPIYVNPAQGSSAIVINGRDSTVDLTGLNVLQLAGRAYVSLGGDDKGLPHVLMGESISVKSNQIAYLVPPECVGTLDGKAVIGQNPVSFATWIEMVQNLPDYQAEGDFRIVNANLAAAKLGGSKLNEFGIGDVTTADFDGIDLTNLAEVSRILNAKAETKGIRCLYMPDKQQVYLYLVMDAANAERYFTKYYNVNSNKASLDSYFNTYASGGIRLKEDVKGYTVVGNSMVSVTAAGNPGEIQTNADGDKLVRLLSSVKPEEDKEGEEGEGGGTEEETPADPDAYTEVSDNITETENAKENLDDLIKNCGTVFENLNRNLMEEEDASALKETVFENLVEYETPAGAAPGSGGMKKYLEDIGEDEAEFVTGDGLKAVLADNLGKAAYVVGDKVGDKVDDKNLRLVIASGDVSVQQNFQGLIIAGGTITVEGNYDCKTDAEGVYSVLQATPVDDLDDTEHVPANILAGGSGMVLDGYEGAEADELGNLAIDYSEIVRYENWIKK